MHIKHHFATFPRVLYCLQLRQCVMTLVLKNQSAFHTPAYSLGVGEANTRICRVGI